LSEAKQSRAAEGEGCFKTAVVPITVSTKIRKGSLRMPVVEEETGNDKWQFRFSHPVTTDPKWSSGKEKGNPKATVYVSGKGKEIPLQTPGDLEM
jgi:hypothetical protein